MTSNLLFKLNKGKAFTTAFVVHCQSNILDGPVLDYSQLSINTHAGERGEVYLFEEILKILSRHKFAQASDVNFAFVRSGIRSLLFTLRIRYCYSHRQSRLQLKLVEDKGSLCRGLYQIINITTTTIYNALKCLTHRRCVLHVTKASSTFEFLAWPPHIE